jgi:RimJ/RimL family protein N-acetyltransferase
MSEVKIKLRLITKDDIEWLRTIRNQYRDHFFTHDVITPEQQRRWYQAYADSTGRDYMYIIELPDGTKIGTIALYNINMSDRTADLGRILLREEYWNHGIMEKAINMVLNLAFNSMRLFKVRIATFLDNAGAIALYHKCGFKSLDRPVMLMEKKNIDMDWNKPVMLQSYEELDESYEGQASNVK